MAETKIPESLLSEFKNMDSGAETPRNGLGSEAAVYSLEESLSWIVGMTDNYMRENNYTGLGEIKAKDFSQVTAAVIRKRYPELLTNNSPEAVLALMVSGLLVVNLRDHARIQKDKKEKKENEKSKAAKDLKENATGRGTYDT